MSELQIVLVIAVLFLVPLAPALAIYYLLSNRRRRDKSRVGGQFKDLNLFGMQVSFEAAGSTATYLIILGLAVGLFVFLKGKESEKQIRQAEIALEQHKLSAKSAWQVRVPIYIKSGGKTLPASDFRYGQVRTMMKPFPAVSNNMLVAWVVPQADGRFPQIDVQLEDMPPVALDLNDEQQIERDETTGTVRISQSAVLETGTLAPYSPAPAVPAGGAVAPAAAMTPTGAGQ